MACRQRRLHLAHTLVDRAQGRLAARSIRPRQYRVLDRHRTDAGRLQLLDGAAHVERIAVAMVGVDQQCQVAGSANAVGLSGEFGQGQDDEIGGAEHRHRPDRAGKHPDLEAEILGDARRDRVVDGSRMHTAVAGKDRAKALAPFGPVHGVSPLAGFLNGFSRQQLIMAQHGSKGFVVIARSGATKQSRRIEHCRHKIASPRSQ